MRSEELVGSLQTFEFMLPKHKYSKNIAFKIKVAKGKSVDLFDEDFGDDEELVMLARKFRKIFKSNNENLEGVIQKIL
jgi:hypothetical protein